MGEKNALLGERKRDLRIEANLIILAKALQGSKVYSITKRPYATHQPTKSGSDIMKERIKEHGNFYLYLCILCLVLN